MVMRIMNECNEDVNGGDDGVYYIIARMADVTRSQSVNPYCQICRNPNNLAISLERQ